MRWFATMLMALICVGMAGPVDAAEVTKIQDNSFLLEEAYNQEDGVIQHIQSFLYNKKTQGWVYSFTEEWPVPKQAHQLSVTLLGVHLREGDTTGLDDIALNYRYQLIMNGPLAVSPILLSSVSLAQLRRLGSPSITASASLPSLSSG